MYFTLTEWEKYVEVTLTQGQMVIEILLLIYTARGRFQYAQFNTPWKHKHMPEQ